MRRLRVAVLVVIAIALVIGAVFFAIGILRPKGAGIFVETIPESTVYIEGIHVGRTPYKATRDPGEVVIKLIPDSFEKPLAPYETRVNLVSGVETAVRREFAETDNDSAGEIVSFEKIGRNETGLSVVTVPDSAQVSIDASVKAFAPYKTSTIVPGEHVLTLSTQGYKERSIKIRTVNSYKLTAIVKLAPSNEPIEPEEPEEEETEEEFIPMVEILSTPTGFLRVREEPTTLSEEVARVEPGDQFIFIEEDEDSGWYKIDYEDGEEGWVSNTYAKLIEEEETEEEMTPTVTPKTTPEPTES